MRGDGERLSKKTETKDEECACVKARDVRRREERKGGSKRDVQE